MKLTLLEMVQRVLASMESDEVSNVGETQESVDVANIIRDCYYDIVGYGNLKEHQGLFKLDASGDDTKPVLMTIPSNVIKIDWLKYNSESLSEPEYTDLRFCTNEEFLFYQNGLDPDDSATQAITISLDGTDFIFKYKNDRAPTRYSIFDESKILFDAFDADLEDTLTQVRSLGYGLISPTFSLSNTWTPDLDHRQFQLLLQDAISTAHIELKQAPNPKAEQKYRQNRILAQKVRDDNNPKSSQQTHMTFGRQPR